MSEPKVFVVTSDPTMADSARELVDSAGLVAEILPSVEAFLAAVGTDGRGCLVLDAQNIDFAGKAQQERLAAAFARMPGVLIVDLGDVPMAVRAVKTGAMVVVERPYRARRLLEAIKQALAADTALRC